MIEQKNFREIAEDLVLEWKDIEEEDKMEFLMNLVEREDIAVIEEILDMAVEALNYQETEN